MSKLQFFILGLVLAVVGAEVFNINARFDAHLKKVNKQIRDRGETTCPFKGNSTFYQNISYSDGIFFGLDSLKRSGNCTLKTYGSVSIYDFHIGWNLFGFLFKKLTIHGHEMSALLRIRDVSKHVRFTVHNSTRCHVTVDDMRWERMRNYEFVPSCPKYSNYDVNKLFQLHVVPEANRHMAAMRRDKKMLRYFQKFCHRSPLDDSFIRKPILF